MLRSSGTKYRMARTKRDVHDWSAVEMLYRLRRQSKTTVSDMPVRARAFAEKGDYGARNRGWSIADQAHTRKQHNQLIPCDARNTEAQQAATRKNRPTTDSPLDKRAQDRHDQHGAVEVEQVAERLGPRRPQRDREGLVLHQLDVLRNGGNTTHGGTGCAEDDH